MAADAGLGAAGVSAGAATVRDALVAAGFAALASAGVGARRLLPAPLPAGLDSDFAEAVFRAAGFPLLGRAAAGTLGTLFPGALAPAFSGAFALERLDAGAPLAVAGFAAGAGFAAADFDVAAFGFVDLRVEAGVGALAEGFTAGFAAVLTPVFAGALVVDPRLFPADAAMAGLWLLWFEVPQ